MSGYEGGEVSKKAAIWFVLFWFTIALVRCTRQPSEEASPQVGHKAPGFELSDLSGNKIALNQYKGKIVMLDFWATWCGPCRMTMPVVERIQKEFQNDLIVLAINIQESRNVVGNYVSRQRVTSRVLLDETGRVGTEYGSESIPMQVLIDRDGVIRHVQVGYSSRMAAMLRAQISKLL
jgi:thiol-disulfide isomerase/thioredoxin